MEKVQRMGESLYLAESNWRPGCSDNTGFVSRSDLAANPVQLDRLVGLRPDLDAGRNGLPHILTYSLVSFMPSPDSRCIRDDRDGAVPLAIL